VKKNETMLWQVDNRQGWLLMMMYWAIGAIVGVQWGYLPFHISDSCQTIQHYVAAFVTLVVQPRLLSRFGSFGRKRNWFAVLEFAVLNGTSETVLFLASYDAGKTLAKCIGAPHSVAVAVGFTTFCCYSGLIHAKFWLPHAFPRYTLPTAPPFYQHGLPELTLVSAAWLWLYESTGDTGSVCALHALTDFLGGAKMSLPSPFTTRLPTINTK
jgi:hypothetical protein